MSSLNNMKKEKVDLETVPVDDVFRILLSSKEGLVSDDTDRRLQEFGPNKLEEKKEHKVLKFLGFMWNPLSWVMEVAVIIAIVLTNGQNRPSDWPNFLGIVLLILINSIVSFIEENNTNNVAVTLMAGLAPKTKVLRDGSWKEMDASLLVQGNVISIVVNYANQHKKIVEEEEPIDQGSSSSSDHGLDLLNLDR